jgi:hypothetical protein
MTSFFDDYDREVTEASQQDDKSFLSHLGSIEEGLIKWIYLCCGDRQFPADMRERIMGIIAVHRIELGCKCAPSEDTNDNAVEYAKATRSSKLVSELHSAFHKLASSRYKTRFGILGDNPKTIIMRRDDHDDPPLPPPVNNGLIRIDRDTGMPIAEGMDGYEEGLEFEVSDG